MKILHTVEFYHPSVGGMQEVVKQLSERLVRMGHDVTVATTRLPERIDKEYNGVKIVEFAISGNLVRGMRGEIDEYRRFLKESAFEVVSNFAAQQWATDVAITMLDEIPGRKVFIPTGFSGLYLPQFRDYFAAMKGWLRRYDMNVFLSNKYRDINFARDCGAANIMVIPNGASEDEFIPDSKIDIRAELGITDDSFLVLHVGSHTGLKGHAEALRIFAGARIDNATLVIAANNVPGGCGRSCRLRGTLYNIWFKRFDIKKQVIVTTLPREETVAAYKAADLFLFPSQVECSPLVLFECMASHTPFVSTDAGNAAEIVGWSGGGVILPTRTDRKGYSHADVARSRRVVEGLWQDSGARGRLAEGGFAAWQERFCWGSLAREYEGLYRNIL
ncbi:MAG: glycosyltransferase family 4 protein [Desulfuromonadaceae bacterium]|nr:glycosyltransferase family 4 protein [Desulfuromonadaceae bacterium]MDD5107510.1 glycosyltransferase family 4 protein [Desulfuromonadaceae bacterium]